MTPEVFAAGGVIVDNIVEADGTVHLGQLGGNALYAAAGARLFADMVGVVGHVPADYPALDALDMLDIRGIARVAGETALPEWFFHNPDGSRVDHLHASVEDFVAFGLGGPRLTLEQVRCWRDHLATQPADRGFAAFRARHPVLPEHVPQDYWAAKGMHVGPNAITAQIALARAARARGLIVTCDPGFHAAAMPEDDLRALLALADAFLPSEKELAALRPGLMPEAALRSLGTHARGVVCVKRGSHGALLLPRADAAAVVIPVVAVVARDPTGAGDTFCGAFLASLTQGFDPLESASRGATAASFAVEGPGVPGVLRASRQEAGIRLASVRARVTHS